MRKHVKLLKDICVSQMFTWNQEPLVSLWWFTKRLQNMFWGQCSLKGIALSCCRGRSSKSPLGGAMTVTTLVGPQRSRIIMMEQACTLYGSRGVRNMALLSETIEERPLQPDYAIPLNTSKFAKKLTVINSKITDLLWFIFLY